MNNLVNQKFGKLLVLDRNGSSRHSLTGLPISFATSEVERLENKMIKTASLDRIDSSKGYIEGNVQWVHKDVNFMKHSLSQERLIELCQLIIEQLGVS